MQPEALHSAETILLVEDDPSVRVLTTRILERSGFRVIAAEGFDEAIRQAASAADVIRLIITDVMMPGGSGAQLSTALSASGLQAATLFISGYEAALLSKRGLVPEGCQFLQKPFSRLELVTRVRQMIDATHGPLTSPCFAGHGEGHGHT